MSASSGDSLVSKAFPFAISKEAPAFLVARSTNLTWQDWSSSSSRAEFFEKVSLSKLPGRV